MSPPAGVAAGARRAEEPCSVRDEGRRSRASHPRGPEREARPLASAWRPSRLPRLPRLAGGDRARRARSHPRDRNPVRAGASAHVRAAPDRETAPAAAALRLGPSTGAASRDAAANRAAGRARQEHCRAGADADDDHTREEHRRARADTDHNDTRQEHDGAWPGEDDDHAREEAVMQILSRLRLPAHWRLLSFCFFVVVVAILFEGIATHTVGASAEPHESVGGQAPLANSRPILVAQGSELVSRQPPPGRRIALTFDDGPSPRWTPEIAAVLHREHVPATFFVIGSEATRHPDVIRTLVRDGFQLGNHTFTHVALSNGPGWERRLQIDLTEAAIAGITGRYMRLIRPPYSATPDAVAPLDERDLAALAGRRYLIVLANYDSEDWTRPGVAKIVRNASPPGVTGGIVMLHD